MLIVLRCRTALHIWFMIRTRAMKWTGIRNGRDALGDFPPTLLFVNLGGKALLISWKRAANMHIP
jgi:hypothetical protein